MLLLKRTVTEGFAVGVSVIIFGNTSQNIASTNSHFWPIKRANKILRVIEIFLGADRIFERIDIELFHELFWLWNRYFLNPFCSELYYFFFFAFNLRSPRNIISFMEVENFNLYHMKWLGKILELLFNSIEKVLFFPASHGFI